MIVGDFNANISSGPSGNSVFGKNLLKFAKEGNFVISDYNLLPDNTFTYLRYAWNFY